MVGQQKEYLDSKSIELTGDSVSVFTGYHGLRCVLNHGQPESEDRVGQIHPFIDVRHAHVQTSPMYGHRMRTQSIARDHY